jgi:ATP10 protein
LLGSQRCELQILRWQPFKSIIVNYDTRLKDHEAIGLGQRHWHAVYFGDISVLTETLQMTNRLTSYIFVLDEDGRVRWRSSGQLLESDKGKFLAAVNACISSCA